jgi:hypothetical protein
MATKPTNPFTAKGGSGGVEGGSPASIAGPVDAQSLMSGAGGNPSGRPRDDGLPAGSPEAVEADKKRDRERKREARAKARQTGGQGDAPPLPSLADAPSAPLLDSSPVPWDPTTVLPLVETISGSVEKKMTDSQKSKASKIIDAPLDFVGMVEKDGQWGKPIKTSLDQSLSQVIAKWMNRFGVSADNAPEAILIGAVCAIWAKTALLNTKLDEMLAKQKAKEAPKAVAVASAPKP